MSDFSKDDAIKTLEALLNSGYISEEEFKEKVRDLYDGNVNFDANNGSEPPSNERSAHDNKGKKRKRKNPLLAFIICLVVYLVFCRIMANCLFGLHVSNGDGSCTEDELCLICGKVLKTQSGHSYPENSALCSNNVYCLKCYEKIPPLADHILAKATCVSPAVCIVCGEKSGSALGHSYINGTCTRCGAKNYGIWDESYYVDSFGDKTNKDYVYAYAYGTFSNSAVTGRELKIQFLFDKDKSCLQLYEYGISLVKGYSSKTVYYNITVKTSSGKIISLTGSLEKDSDRIQISERKSLYNALSEGGIVKFYIENKDRKIENYTFSIDSDGFKSMWDKHWAWK